MLRLFIFPTYLKIVCSFKNTGRRSRNFYMNKDELKVIELKFVSKMQNGMTIR
jgi:hypothetical protein